MFYSNSEDKIIALMIDGDNVSSEYIEPIEQTAAIIGRVTHKRLYYTFNKGIPNGWEAQINAHALRPVQVLPYTNGKRKTVKNVADSALIIDAMDIKSNVNTMLIVASDSDYTILVKRLKEDGIYVIGAGDKDTPNAFIEACDEFRYLEKLKEQYEEVSRANETSAAAQEEKSGQDADKPTVTPEKTPDGRPLIPKKEIEAYIIRLFESQDKNVLNAGYINKSICTYYKTFDFKDYPGVKKFPDFFDPRIFTVVMGEGKNTAINIQYPAVKRKK